MINSNREFIEVFVLYLGNINQSKYIRLNSACFTSDIFGCTRCDCNWQFEESMRIINRKKNGMIIYMMHHEGRGAGIVNKLKTLSLMDKNGLSTFEAFKALDFKVDMRSYLSAVTILHDLQIKSLNMITNNPSKIDVMKAYGIEVIKRIPIVSKDSNMRKYLLSKKKEFGHIID